TQYPDLDVLASVAASAERISSLTDITRELRRMSLGMEGFEERLTENTEELRSLRRVFELMMLGD
ncbi:hypothetical protein HDV00_005803, partial [Rhizophlyctis rosea]